MRRCRKVPGRSGHCRVRETAVASPMIEAMISASVSSPGGWSRYRSVVEVGGLPHWARSERAAGRHAHWAAARARLGCRGRIRSRRRRGSGSRRRRRDRRGGGSVPRWSCGATRRPLLIRLPLPSGAAQRRADIPHFVDDRDSILNPICACTEGSPDRPHCLPVGFAAAMPVIAVMEGQAGQVNVSAVFRLTASSRSPVLAVKPASCWSVIWLMAVVSPVSPAAEAVIRFQRPCRWPRHTSPPPRSSDFDEQLVGASAVSLVKTKSLRSSCPGSRSLVPAYSVGWAYSP